MIVLQHVVPLHPGDSLRLTLEATKSGGPIVRVGKLVQRPGGPELPTPCFALEVADVRRLAAELATFADLLEREAGAREHAKRQPARRP